MTIQDLEKTAKGISESMFASRILSMNYTDSEIEQEHAGDFSPAAPEWRMFCNDVETYFRRHPEISSDFINRFSGLKAGDIQTGKITKAIIDDIRVLLHEIGNEE